MILPVRSGGALAVAALAGLAVASVSSGSTRQSAPRPTVPRTVNVTNIVRATKTQPGVPVLVSQRLAALGSSVTSPRGPYIARPKQITFSTSRVGSGLAVYVDHLKWVDWNQPVAFASGIVHT